MTLSSTLQTNTASEPINSMRPSHTSNLTITDRSIDALKPHPDNPRIHTPRQVDQIAQSIKVFGFRFPVLIDGDDRIIAGHGRVLACRQLGIVAVPTLLAKDLSQAQIRALMLADNKLAENAKWDEALLGENFKILSEIALDFDIEVSGFEYGHIEQLMMSIEPDTRYDSSRHLDRGNHKTDEFTNPGDDPAIAPDPLDDPGDDQPTVSRLGDVWDLGDHCIICADALSSNPYRTLLGRHKASMVITDPPYNLPARMIGKVAEKTHGNFHEAAGEMDPAAYIGFLEAVFSKLRQYSRSGSIHYVFMDWRHSPEILTAGARHYDGLKNLCVWVKDRAGMGSFYRSQHELIFVFKNGKGRHQNNMALGQYGRNRSNVWSYPGVRSATKDASYSFNQSALLLHPTIKPVRLIADAMLDCSRRNDWILDAFMGSGSTVLAAEQTQRKAVGIEVEPRYVDVAIRRWQAMTGCAALHRATAETFETRANQVITDTGSAP